jgi:outer membrane protein assembly factor BamE (lipoprotein component of BamABCDE complex)
MTLRKICILLSLFAWLLVAVSCNRSVVTGSKLTLSNYDQITTRMTKAQVERILGPPTTVETKDMMIFKKQLTGTTIARNLPCSHSRTTS